MRIVRTKKNISFQDQMLEILIPTPQVHYYYEVLSQEINLTLLVAGGRLFLSTPRVFLKSLRNGLS